MSIKTNATNMMRVAMNKSLLKEYSLNDSRVVYLKDGDEFQIQLLNPEKFTVGAEVAINGEQLPGILILRPGERMWLERYTDKAVKFKFSTYEVENASSEEVQNAIADNGEIVVNFYRSRKRNSVYHNTISPDDRWWRNSIPSEPLETKYTSFEPDKVYCCDVKTVAAPASNTYSSGSNINSTTVDAIYNCRLNNSLDNIIRNSVNETFENIPSTYSSTSKTSDIIETGRIDEGSHSSQAFKDVDVDLESTWYKIERVKILPFSRKPIQNSDLHKIYCPNCGRKIKTKFKFCPYCGEKLDI